MSNEKITLRVSDDDDDVAYLFLPKHQGAGKSGAIAKQVRLSSLLKYDGPDLYLDFDNSGTLVGIEILN